MKHTNKNGNKKNMNSIITYLIQEKIEHFLNGSIKPYVTMEIGGTVPLLAVVRSTAQLTGLLTRLVAAGKHYILLGGGSNIIFPENMTEPGFTAIVNRSDAIEKINETLIKVDSGVMNSRLTAWNESNNIGGMEFLCGVPGTVGGAAAVNAGAFGTSISTILKKADIFTADGEILSVDTDYFEFQYRNSRFKYGDQVILSVYLEYTFADNETIRTLNREKLEYRAQRHPCAADKSAGCFFKNPELDGQKTPAGKLIESCGFKGKNYDTLRIADAHANFIINRGNAVLADIEALVNRIVADVERQNAVRLEREVIFVSPAGEKY